MAGLPTDIDWGWVAARQAEIDAARAPNGNLVLTGPNGELVNVGVGDSSVQAANQLLEQGYRLGGALPNSQTGVRPDSGPGSMQPANPAGGSAETEEQRKAREKEAEKARAGRNISASIRATLKEFFTEGEVESLGQLIDQLLTTDASEDEIFLKVRDSQVWKDRFKGNEIRRAKGLTVLSPAEYISVERQTRQLFQEAGMPEGFYDSRDDFNDIIGRDISPREMSRRIQNGYVKVSQADPRIREAFGEYFGANGDAALASMFLDYNKAVDVLERHVAAATFGGTAKRFGFNVNFAKSNLAAGLGVDQGRAEQGMAEVAEMQPLFTETVTEQEDMVAEEQGFNSVFGFDANSAAAIRRRREERVARQSGAGGGSLTTAKGSLGLSVAR